MSDHNCTCPQESLMLPLNGLGLSINAAPVTDLLKDRPTRKEVDEKIKDAKENVEEQLRETKTELEEKITETKQGLEEKIQDTKDELDGKINDTRNDLEEKIRDAAEDADAKFVPQTRSVNTTAPLTGGGKLDHDLTLAIDPALLDSLATKGGVEQMIREALAEITAYELCEFYFFRHPTLRPGFQLAQGGLLANAATLYPEAWAYLQTPEGQKLCKTEAEWQAMTKATWATLADGTKVGWNGIGGAPFYAPNTATGALRLPDLRGMYAEAAGFDGLGVGGVHGDAMRNITAGWIVGWEDGFLPTVHPSGAVTTTWGMAGQKGTNVGPAETQPFQVVFDASRIVPTAAKNAPRAWGALACVYLGRPAS